MTDSPNDFNNSHTTSSIDRKVLETGEVADDVSNQGGENTVRFDNVSAVSEKQSADCSENTPDDLSLQCTSRSSRDPT